VPNETSGNYVATKTTNLITVSFFVNQAAVKELKLLLRRTLVQWERTATGSKVNVVPSAVNRLP